MSNQGQKIEGTAQKLGGKLKAGVGRILGNRRIEAEGRATELKGRARVASAKATGQARGQAKKLVGAAKNRVRRAVGR